MPDYQKGLHPGVWFREHYLKPSGMTVKDAAARIGVARQTFSAFINGRAGITTRLAVRLEMVFKVSARELLERQTAFLPVVTEKKREAAPEVRRCVPPFLSIKANDLVRWADELDARSRLGVLLRVLVHSTGTALRQVDFPGYDDSERPGWDGWVEADVGTPWIPEGMSGWEFGVNKDCRRKAESDFKKRTAQLTAAERLAITYVFVTPRRWPDKDKKQWTANKRAQGRWRDVRVYDACDLEQWLEQSLPGQTWFAENIPSANKSADGVRTLEGCWHQWADVSVPPLSATFFKGRMPAAVEVLSAWLKQANVPQPLMVTAETEEDGLAFLACAFREPPLAEAANRVLVFDKGEAFERLSTGRDLFVAVTHSGEAEQATVAAVSTVRCIRVVSRCRLRGDVRPTIDLGMMSAKAFADGLRAMGKTPDAVEQLERQTGGSLTVLRRLLAVDTPAVREPSWCWQSVDVRRVLLAAAFLGAWKVKTPTEKADDEALLSFLTGFTEETVEDHWKTLYQLTDSPVWEAGNCRGVISKYDVFFALSPKVTRYLWRRFQQVVQAVLPPVVKNADAADGDNALEGRYSAVVRYGVSETIVFLAANGKALFGEWQDFNGTPWTETWVRGRLMPITAERLETEGRYLAFYAETAPTVFLDLLEEAVRQSDSDVSALMRSEKQGWMTPCPWTELLNALEVLAWEPVSFRRSVELLARLATVGPQDRGWKGPSQSLENVFRCWMPQTLVTAEGRLREIERLLEQFPSVAWPLLLQYVDEDDRVGEFNCKPRWRRRSADYGDTQTVSHEEIQAAADVLLSQPHYEVGQLTDLVKHLKDFTVADCEKAFQRIERWHQTEGMDEASEMIRRALRQYVLARNDTPDDIRLMAEALCDRLASDDDILRNAWLFGGFWDVEVKTKASVADWPRRLERHQTQQTEMVGTVYGRYGLEGLWQLAAKADAPKEVGAAVARAKWSQERLTNLVEKAASGGETRHHLVSGWMEREPRARVATVLQSVKSRVSTEAFKTLLLQAPFAAEIWRLMEGDAALTKMYWATVTPQSPFPGDEVTAVQSLISVGRPWAAFETIQWAPERLEPSLLVSLLRTMADDEWEAHPTIHESQIREAVKTVEVGDTLTLEEKAQLEFLWAPVLGSRWDGDNDVRIPWLERYVRMHPSFFVQRAADTFFRDDGTKPTSGLDEKATERKRRRGRFLFRSLMNLPGSGETGDVRQKVLLKWIQTVRTEAQQLNVAEATDVCIGQWLARSPADDDGMWPASFVCEALEAVLPSETLAKAVVSERRRMLGAHWLDENGTASRKEGERYRECAECRAETYPFVAAQILKPLAERFDEQSDTAGARVISQRCVYR